MFCTYLTTYSGDKLPQHYVGSSSIERVEKGYRGTVLSKKYSETWNQELKENPHLFQTKILTTHDTRESALEEELRFQKEHDVVKSNDWINESFAAPNGFFGRDVSGENNPNYGNGDKLREYYKNLSEEEWEELRERNRLGGFKQWENADERREKHSKSMRTNIQKWRKENPEEFSEQQRKKSLIANENVRENKCIHLEYEGITYRGYSEMVKKTGITKWYIKKMIENNQIKVVKNPS